MTKEMSEEVLLQYQEWLNKCPIQFHAHGFGNNPLLIMTAKRSKQLIASWQMTTILTGYVRLMSTSL